MSGTKIEEIPIEYQAEVEETIKSAYSLSEEKIEAIKNQAVDEIKQEVQNG